MILGPCNWIIVLSSPSKSCIIYLMDEEDHLLHRPLIPKETKEFNWIIFRIAFIISIGLIALWANHEASKGFAVTVIKYDDCNGDKGIRFNVLYVSTDKATRIVYTSSKFVEHFLYPDETYIKKQVNHVIIQLSSRNLTESVNVESRPDGEYVMYISPSVMTEMINCDQAMHLAIQKGMARIWIYDGAPTDVVDGMVEYITRLAISISGDVYRKTTNTTAMVDYLTYHEMNRVGFIRRLNQNLRNQWQDWMVDDTPGSTGQ